MKNKESDKLNLLRVVSGEFSRLGKEVTDQQAISIIRKMFENAQQMGDKIESKILNEYLPQMFDYNQTRTLIALMIENNNFSGMKDMGNVMKLVKTHEKAHLFDGKTASNVAKELL